MSNLLLSNIETMGIATVTANLGSVATVVTEEETFTVVGVKVGDFVMVSKSTHKAGYGVCSARVSADDTVAVTIVNPTGGAVDDDADTLTVAWFRPTSVRASVEG